MKCATCKSPAGAGTPNGAQVRTMKGPRTMATTVQKPLHERRAEPAFTPRRVARNDWIAAFLLTAFEGAKTLEQREQTTAELHALVDAMAAQHRAGVPA